MIDRLTPIVNLSKDGHNSYDYKAMIYLFNSETPTTLQES